MEWVRGKLAPEEKLPRKRQADAIRHRFRHQARRYLPPLLERYRSPTDSSDEAFSKRARMMYRTPSGFSSAISRANRISFCTKPSFVTAFRERQTITISLSRTAFLMLCSQSSADSHRRSGSFATHRRSSRSSAGGATSAIEGGLRSRIAAIRLAWLLPSNAGFPVSIL